MEKLGKIITNVPYLPKHLDTPYNNCPKTEQIYFRVPVDAAKNYWMSGKQSKPWSDATFCGIWSWSALFAQAHLSEYLG